MNEKEDYQRNKDHLKQLRLSHNLSQHKFADILNVQQHQISDWESGKIQLSNKRLQWFINILKECEKHNKIAK